VDGLDVSPKMTMRAALICLFALLPGLALAQDEKPAAPAEKEQKIPRTLAEAHAELERVFPAEELKKIDAMKSEDEMIEYHFGLGMGIRNSWGLWGGSPLSKHMQDLGFTHADDMSGVILETFWCKRHGKPFRLKERAAENATYWEAARKAEEEETERVESAKQKMRAMMMGLELDMQGVATVKMPDRVDRSIRARFLAPHNNGVFIAVRTSRGSGDDEFVTEPYFFSSDDRKIHKVSVPELAAISSVVLAGRTVWICGDSDGSPALLGISTNNRKRLDLPKEGGTPQLGVHEESLLAVYPKSVYELVDGEWKVIYEGDIAIPRSGPPPKLVGDDLYLRDEGSGENNKRLWWLRIGSDPSLISLDKDLGVVGSNGPRWENSFSYSVALSGELWACVGEGYARKSLLRRSKDGAYSIAVMNNSVHFTPELFGSKETDQGISISAVLCLDDDSILLVGDAGLYRLKGKVLTQELAFTNTRQEIPINNGDSVYHWGWDPSKITILGEDSYFISGAFGGIYLLRRNESKKWIFESLDEELGEPITW
jgi:hypothetical protein